MDDEWMDVWLDGWLFVLSELGCQSFLPLGIKFWFVPNIYEISPKKHKFGFVIIRDIKNLSIKKILIMKLKINSM